jgi:hypothetical protein
MQLLHTYFQQVSFVRCVNHIYKHNNQQPLIFTKTKHNMKKRYLPFVMCGLLLSGTMAQAQKIDAVKETASKKNVFKVNLTSLLFKNFSFQYERVIARKTSVALGVSVMPKTGLPFASTLKDQFGDNSDAARAIDETQLSNFSITPEVRFYLGRKPAPAGFYIAPFVRYNQLKFDQFYRFDVNKVGGGTEEHVANIKGTINNVGGGLLLGAQWNLGKSLSLDWWIAGPIIGSSNGDLAGNDPKGIPVTDRQQIKEDIESTDIPGWTVKADVQQNDIKVNMKGTYYGLRAFGIALGYRF